MTTTESPTVSPGSREADTATPVTGRHAHDEGDILTPSQVLVRIDHTGHLFARRRLFPAYLNYQPRHEAREWGAQHSIGVMGPFISPRDTRPTAGACLGNRYCTLTPVSRVLPDGEWEVAS